ncbi:MAG: response regulator [Alphaproteobacteria bacterium]|nr:response regulator [Alphaproteobacteria bacterium]
MTHVLIVDDDVRLADLIANYLRRQNLQASIAHSAVEARQLLAVFRFDLLVMDVMMPGETGLEFVGSWRQQNDDIAAATPILLLTALGEGHDRIAGLEVGADDYLTKPFEPRELLLRIEAILRRHAAPAPPSATAKLINLGVFHYDITHRRLWCGSDLVALTSKESEILAILVQNLGEAVSRQILYDGLNSEGKFTRNLSLSDERAIDVAISRLRRKIESDPKHPLCLQTVHGKGYALIPTN